MGVLWEDEAWQEYIDWQQDKKTLKKITPLNFFVTVNSNDGGSEPYIV